MITIASLREKMAQLGEERHCITPDDTLSPYLNPPHNNFAPGRLEDIAFAYHEAYPEVFPKKTGFMGDSEYSCGGDSFWEKKFERVYFSEGHFDNQGFFHAPIAVYKSGNKTHPQYVLFQQGNYQIINGREGGSLEEGEIILYRGIGSAEFEPPELDESRRQAYLDFLAGSFATPLVALAYNNVSRSESNHVKIDYDHPVIKKFYNPGVHFRDI